MTRMHVWVVESKQDKCIPTVLSAHPTKGQAMAAAREARDQASEFFSELRLKYKVVKYTPERR